MRKQTVLLAAALATTLAVAPAVADASGGDNGGHHGKKVCGIVDATSTLPTSIVLNLPGTKVATIANPAPGVVLPAEVVAGADVCAKVRKVRNLDGTKSKVLKAIKVLPAAIVTAKGPATLGVGTITVGSLLFTIPDGVTLPPTVIDGSVVKVTGEAAVAGGPLMLTKLRASMKKHGKSHHNGGSKGTQIEITGRVSEPLTPADALVPGSITVGGIVLTIPAGKTLKAKVAVGARVRVSAKLVGVAPAVPVLTVKKIKVLAKAHVAVAMPVAPAV